MIGNSILLTNLRYRHNLYPSEYVIGDHEDVKRHMGTVQASPDQRSHEMIINVPKEFVQNETEEPELETSWEYAPISEKKASEM